LEAAIRTFTRINHQIRVSEVRCVDVDGTQLGVISTSKALELAERRGVDLVEVAAQAQPPVCRLVNYGKYRYDMEKKEKQSQRSNVGSKVKEVKFHANVEQHDYDTKLRHIKDFLTEGHRVKVSLMFRGRENAHQELGHQVMARVIQDASDIGHTERPPEKMGRILVMMITPRPAVKNKASSQSAPQG